MPLLADIQQDRASKLTVDALKVVRDGYLDELDKLDKLDKLGGDKRCIADKLPLNFRWIGFIVTAMPEAKVINLNRDPIATCWSLFKHYFSSKGNRYVHMYKLLLAENWLVALRC